ncbi:MAG: hypothetical protein RML84_09260 [Anaerolineae bacterium]|nr:hypothetical protein [Anaerolineae bacterium]
MSDLLDIYLDDSTSLPIDVEVFVWHQPFRPENVGKPIERGGLSSSARDGAIAWGQKFTMRYADGREEERYGGAELDIYPLLLSNPFTIVTASDGRRVYVPQAMYVKRDEVPPEYRVRTARALLFVVADDEQARLCAVTFKSFNSDHISRAYGDFCRAVLGISRKQYGKAVSPAMVRAVLRVGKVEAVGQAGKSSMIAQPQLALPNNALVLAPPDKAEIVREYLDQREMLARYPFFLERTRPITAPTLPWLAPPDAQHRALPTASPSPIEGEVWSGDDF